MKYYVNLFSPQTAQSFTSSKKDITGFRPSRKTYIENQNMGNGDRLICYCTKVQRFIGVLEIIGDPFIDDTPIFVDAEDPFTLRMNVKVIVWLPLDMGIPIHDKIIWDHLSFTKGLHHDSTKWTYMVFSSPRLWNKNDCKYIESVLLEQQATPKEYPFSEADERKIRASKIKLDNKKETIVSVPENIPIDTDIINKKEIQKEQRESIKTQALLSSVGEKLGFKIWIPKSDRGRVLEIWKPENDSLLDDLPLVFDENTLKTIKNIDILWIKRRSIVRAFEVEDTTSIYSGILRMADLLSLQPMLDIKIHIVAPSSRREVVFEQITRPVFAVMEKGPLAEICTYISYDSLIELSKEKRLEHMTDSILDEYLEYANE